EIALGGFRVARLQHLPRGPVLIEDRGRGQVRGGGGKHEVGKARRARGRRRRDGLLRAARQRQQQHRKDDPPTTQGGRPFGIVREDVSAARLRPTRSCPTRRGGES